MEKVLKIMALVFVLSLGVYWTSAFAGPMGAAGAGEACAYTAPMSDNTMEAGRLIGLKIESPAHGNLGEITDFLIDKTDGHIALVIISDSPYMGAKLVAAPFSALERLGDNVVQLNFGDREVPVTDMYTDRYAYDLFRSEGIVGLDRVPQTIDTHWADAVYSYFGRTPYWGQGEAPQIVSYRAIENHYSFFRGESAPVLMGSMVQSTDGKITGRIEDLVVDFRNDKVDLLVLDQVPGHGEALVGVPFAELTATGDTFTLNATIASLQPCWSEMGAQSQIGNGSGNL